MSVRDKRIDLTALREVVAQVKASQKVRVFCVVPAGEAVADERAYWLAVRLGALKLQLWVLGDSPAIQYIDRQFKYINKWVNKTEEINHPSIIKLDAGKLFIDKHQKINKVKN